MYYVIKNNIEITSGGDLLQLRAAYPPPNYLILTKPLGSVRSTSNTIKKSVIIVKSNSKVTLCKTCN